jgi:OOP family OmpA-OmpF porin
MVAVGRSRTATGLVLHSDLSAMGCVAAAGVTAAAPAGWRQAAGSNNAGSNRSQERLHPEEYTHIEHRNVSTAAIALLSGGLMLAGCSNWSSSPPIVGNPVSKQMNLAAAQGASPQDPTTFNQRLAVEYASLATTMNHTPMTGNSGDWADADYFARKSMKAGRGEAVAPDFNANRLIPLEQPYGFRTQLTDARERLVRDLDNGGRDQQPALSAVAQSRYDCWVEQMERDWQLGASGTCRAEFLAALDELESPKVGTSAPPPVAAQEYNVFFAFDKSRLSPEAVQIIAEAAKAGSGAGVIRIEVLGKADLAGTDRYNMDLSRRRADAVRDALVDDGIASERIEARWVGEREPPVPTAQGVREQRNRVVEIVVR